MKILLKGREFGDYDGKVVEASLDRSGDVVLPVEVVEDTQRHYALQGEFEILAEEQSLALGKARYIVQLPVEDLLALYLLLDKLPENVVESATLVKI